MRHSDASAPNSASWGSPSSVGKRDRNHRDALKGGAERRQAIPSLRFLLHLHNAAQLPAEIVGIELSCTTRSGISHSSN